jgi:hypothetical protein
MPRPARGLVKDMLKRIQDCGGAEPTGHWDSLPRNPLDMREEVACANKVWR